MDGKMLIRLLAVIFVAFAITAAAIDMARRNDPRSRPPVPFAVDAPDPHRQALVRCQEMGEAAGEDADCLAIWAENRRRFLGQNEGR